MNRTTRSVAAAALAGVVALGAAAPAVAAPPDGVGKPDKVAAKAEKHQSKADKRETRAAMRLERMANRKAGYLDRLSTRHKVTRLGDTGPLLADNMTRDRDFLTDLADGTVGDAEAPEGLDVELTAAQLVRSARPVVYQRIINQVRLIVANDLDALDPVVVEGTQQSTTSEGGTITTEPTVDDVIQEDATGLLDTVLAYHAWTPKSELKATQKQIADLLDELEPEGAEGAEEPTVEETTPDES